MNPPTGMSRFVRGRGRGGGRGSYRPYFYFRRNGKTIPAGENQTNQGSAPSRNNGTRRRGRFANFARIQNGSNSGITSPIGDISFLRADNFAAPEESSQMVHSIAVENIKECPGWRLYFLKENYDENSLIAKRVKVLEKHYLNTSTVYDLKSILDKGYFELSANVVWEDQSIKEVWPELIFDMQTKPWRTLSTFGLAMYSAVSFAVVNVTTSKGPCNMEKYFPLQLYPRKIYVRPVGFVRLTCLSEISKEIYDTMISVKGYALGLGKVEMTSTWICYKCSRCRTEQALRQTGNILSRPYSCKRSECLAKKGFVEKRSSPYTRIRPIQIVRIAEQRLTDADSEQQVQLDVELRYDLANAIKPGKTVILTGVVKMRSLTEVKEQYINKSTTQLSASQIYFKVVSVTDASYVQQNFTDRDKNAIAAINNEPDSFKLLVNSIAPEIYGQEMIKAGMLLSLLGGSGTQLTNECEVNVLLIGDPGTGKSHILQTCAKISDKGTYLNGKRGASVLNTTTQGRSHSSLDLSILTVSTNDIVAIDDVDRLASQQDLLLQNIVSPYTTFAFSGIFATLASTVSVIGSANPLRGHYNHSKLIVENIRISPSLLNQFHLVFVFSDKPNKDLDFSLTEHVHHLHAGNKKSSAIATRYCIKPKLNNSTVTSVEDVDEVVIDENYNLAERLKLSPLEEVDIDLLPPILIKKFIIYAREQVKPLLSVGALEVLKSFYMEMRQEKNDDKTTSINSSQLLGLIKLSQARARIDFSSEVTKLHVRDVISLLRQSISDTQMGDYVDLDRATTKTSQSGSVKKFLKMLQMRSNALSRRTFDLDELRDMAKHTGIVSDISTIIDIVNIQGFLLKKGSNIYEVVDL